MMIRSGALCCAMLFFVACGEVPLAPQSIAGTYALMAVDGEPVPVAMSTDPSNAILLVADTMRLHATGSLEGRRCQRRVDYVHDELSDSCIEYGGSYRVQVRTVEMSFGCRPGQVCTVVALHSARVNGDALIVNRDAPGGTYTFRRIPE